MSFYTKAIAHSNNHKKNRFTQQCGFHMEGSVKSGAAIADTLTEKYYVAVIETKEVVSDTFSNPDDAVDAFRELPAETQNKCGIFKCGICIMK